MCEDPHGNAGERKPACRPRERSSGCASTSVNLLPTLRFHGPHRLAAPAPSPPPSDASWAPTGTGCCAAIAWRSRPRWAGGRRCTVAVGDRGCERARLRGARSRTSPAVRAASDTPIPIEGSGWSESAQPSMTHVPIGSGLSLKWTNLKVGGEGQTKAADPIDAARGYRNGRHVVGRRRTDDRRHAARRDVVGQAGPRWAMWDSGVGCSL